MSLLRLPADLRRYFLGRAFAAFAGSVLFVSLPFIVFEILGAPNQEALGLVLALSAAPRFFGLAMGSLVDRLPLRSAFRASIGLRAATLLLGALLLHLQVLPGSWNLVMLMVIVVVGELCGLVVTTASSALLPRLVDAAALPKANSVLQTLLNGLPLLGYAVGGWVVHLLGGAAALALAGLGFAGALLCLVPLNFPPFIQAARAGWAGYLSDLTAGVQVVRRSLPLLAVLGLSLLLNSVSALLNVLAPVAIQHRGGGAQGYGVMETMLSVGILTGIATAGLLGTRLSLARQTVLALAVAAATFLLFAAAQQVWTFWGAALLFGWSCGLGTIVLVTVLQTATPEGSRGRASGVFESVNALGSVVIPLATGVLTRLTSLDTAYFIGAGALILCSLLYLRRDVFAARAAPPRHGEKSPV